MNLYVVDGGEYTYTDVADPELGGPQMDGYAIDLILAETPGKAKAQLVWDYWPAFEYIDPIRVRLVARNFEDTAHLDNYWLNAYALIDPDFDELVWQDRIDQDNEGCDPFPECAA